MPTLDQFLDIAQPLAQQSAIGLSILLVAAVLVISDWRLALAAYALLKVLAGILLIELIPPEWALLQWIIGGFVGIMWFLSARRVDTEQRRRTGIPWWKPLWRLNPSTLMRASLLFFLIIIVYFMRPTLDLPKLPADLARLTTFYALAGLVGLGLGDRPMRWGMSLSLWFLAATFSLHALQINVEVIGLLAALEILVGFAISYLIVVDGARFWQKRGAA